MNELIKIEQKNGIETVNAKDLHEFLDCKRDFSTWIKDRIDKYNFIENMDFSTIRGESKGGRPSIEYHISIDMAKELSMVENNERGRQARQYFIAREKQAKQFTANFNLIAEMAADIVLKKLDKKLSLSASTKVKKPLQIKALEPIIIKEFNDDLCKCVVEWNGEKYIIQKSHNDYYKWEIREFNSKLYYPIKGGFYSRRDAINFVKRRLGK